MRKSALLAVLLLVFMTGRAAGAFSNELGFAIEDYQQENYAQAFKDFKQLAEHGSVTSQYYLGLLYHRGWGVAKDDAQAVIWMRKAAEHGNVLAQNELGSMYRFGRGVPADSDKASVWYRKAAEHGLAAAQYNLANTLGTFVSRQHEDAGIAWLRRAAWQGNPIYQLELGESYGGSGVSKRQLAKSAFWMRKAAIQDIGPAESYLGMDYLYGSGVRKNPALARMWLQRASAHGSSQAAFTLGQMYQGGADGVAKNLPLAVEWYCKAQAMGYGTGAANAAYQLGTLGTAGRSCLLQMAAAGHAEAQFMLGEQLLYGGDLVHAVDWLRKAAVQNHGFALDQLARLYSKGQGVPRDPVIALALEELSGVAGNGYALRERLEHELTPAQRAEATALVKAWSPGVPLPESSRTWKAESQNQVK